MTVVGNTFWKGAAGDLRAEDCSNIVVGPNILDRNPAYSANRGDEAKGGVVFRRCQDCLLAGLHLSGVRGTPAGLVLEQCRRFHVADCTILDCENAGMLLDEVSDSRIGGCLIRNDLGGSSGWTALSIRGGRNNVIEQPEDR